MIHPHNPFAYWWEFAIGVVDSIYSAFFVPIAIALFSASACQPEDNVILGVDITAGYY